MWVAIYNNAGSGGTVRVEEFRKRADVATAVSQFENDSTPGYAGIDTGWAASVDPPANQEWYIDRDASPDPVLIAVSTPPPDGRCKIFRYLPEGDWDRLSPPTSLNYRTCLDRRLERKTVRQLGDVVSVEYFDSATFNVDGSKSFIDRVLVEEYEWRRDPPGTLSRDITIRWDLEDGSTHAEAKTMTRMYSPDERMLAGEEQRKSIITDLKGFVGGVLVATQASDPTDAAQIEAALDLGRDFIRDYSFQIASYEMASDQSLFVAISSDTTHAWLDVPINGGTMRDAMLAAINIWKI